MKTNLFAAAAALLAAGSAQAAGFSIDTHGARATGMGTAVTAHVDDASASYYNPAGLLGAGTLDLQLGDTLVAPHLSFSRDGGALTQQPRSVSPPPHAFAAGQLGDRLAWGVGLFTPYGAKSQWPADWEGSQRALRSGLSTYVLNPSLAVRLHPSLRLGAGLQLVRGTVEIERALAFPGGTTGSLRLGGAAWGLGANVGVQADVVPRLLSFGASYRGAVALEFQGVADFDNVPAAFSQRLEDQRVTAPVTLPGLASVGVALKPLERLTLAFDANWQQWESFRELRIEFADPALTSPALKHWHNTWNYHLGAEWGVTGALALRGGLVYDPSPSPSGTLTPDLPDADRLKATLGAGYAWGAWRADVGYQYVRLLSKRSSAPGFSGSYAGDAHVAGVTVGFKL